jgi:hypothetical protein
MGGTGLGLARQLLASMNTQSQNGTAGLNGLAAPPTKKIPNERVSVDDDKEA